MDNITLKFCSYDCKAVMKTINELKKQMEKSPYVKFSAIPLPNKQKYYCVNRSPHVNTNSREQFGVKEFSQIADIKFFENKDDENISSNNQMDMDARLLEVMNMVENCNLPAGVYFEVCNMGNNSNI